jgi:hypothetical protein
VPDEVRHTKRYKVPTVILRIQGKRVPRNVKRTFVEMYRVFPNKKTGNPELITNMVAINMGTYVEE